MMDVITRNLLRLIACDSSTERERIEPMSEWKWQRLYKVAKESGIGPWIADGMRCYADDFFLQPSPALREQLLGMGGEKNPESLRRFHLQVERSLGLRHRLSRESVQTYVSDFIRMVKNIEE